jgi:transposase-like protein
MLLENRMYMSEIAREFGVAVTTIHAIKAGETWRNLPAAAPVQAVETVSDLLDQTSEASIHPEEDL